MSKPLVGIIMGSQSDLPVMVEAAKVLEELKKGITQVKKDMMESKAAAEAMLSTSGE